MIRAWKILRLATCCVALLAVACDAPREPVARLDVTPAELTLSPVGSATIELAFTPAAEVAAEPVVFLHLLGATGRVERTWDHPFPGPWVVGEQTRYPHDLALSALAAPLPPGTYQLTAGLYDPVDGARWPLVSPGVLVARDEYSVATVTVPPAAATPRLRFVGDWQSLEAGNDRQVLARRWLGEAGALELVDLDRPVTLRLAVWLAELDPAAHRLILAEGASAPVVTLDSPCAEGPMMLTSTGRTELRVVLTPVAADEETGAAVCPVTIEPNFRYVDLADFSRRSLMLEAVSWDPA